MGFLAHFFINKSNLMLEEIEPRTAGMKLN